MGWGRCHKPCPSAIPNTECPRPIHWLLSLDPMLPQQWSNPDYCYLEPASRVKPEQPHQMAVSTNHNLGGHVIQLTSYLIDMKNYRGFQGYSPFHSHPVQSKCTSKLNLKTKNTVILFEVKMYFDLRLFSIRVNYLRRMVFYVFKYMQYSDLIHNLHVVNVNNILKLYYVLFYII